MKKFSLLALALAGAAMAPAANMDFSYNQENADPSWYGTNKKENYHVAIKIENPALIGAKITGITVPINGEAEYYAEPKAFMTKELVVERIDGVRVNVADICTVDATMANGMLTATFSEPYTITADPVYVGYALNVDQLNTVSKTPIAVAPGTNPDGFWFFSSRTQLKWASYMDKSDNGYQSAMTVHLEGDFPATSAAVQLPSRTVMLTGQTNEFKINVVNGGTDPISSVEILSSLDGTCRSLTYTFDTPIPNTLGAYATATLEIPVPEEAEYGDREISVEIGQVNGVDNTNPSASASSRVIFAPMVPTNRPLVEEYTGTWCGWCVRGYVALEWMKEEYGSDFVAGAWHNADPMAISNSYPNASSGFPSAWINRSISLDPGSLYTDWPKVREDEMDISVDCKVEYLDPEETQLSAKVSVSSIEKVDSPYFIGYLLIADGLKGEDSSWFQKNYFSGSAAQAATLPKPWGQIFMNAPSSVPNLEFNDVVVNKDYAMGVDGSLPTSFEAFSPQTHSVTFDISDLRNIFAKPTAADPDLNLIPILKNKMRVIAFVLRPDGTVVNSCSSDYAESSDPNSVEQVGASAEVAATAFYDLQGRLMKAPVKGQLMVCVQTMTDGTIRSQKVMIK